jgi:hypothetical protein
MSGSNSSAHDAAEPLGLTVHSLPAVDVGAERTRAGRVKMLFVLLVCAAPVIASYFTYFVIRPQGRSNYGTLIEPSRSLPELALRTLEGQPVAGASLKGQWLLVVVGPAGCDAGCEKRLFLQRQLREMLGRDRDRLDKVWLVTDGGMPAPPLREAAAAAPAMQILRADGDAVARWLVPEAGHTLPEHLYVVDPLGEWMMRMPADADPMRVKRDLERLLRASAGWDKAGR